MVFACIVAHGVGVGAGAAFTGRRRCPGTRRRVVVPARIAPPVAVGTGLPSAPAGSRGAPPVASALPLLPPPAAATAPARATAVARCQVPLWAPSWARRGGLPVTPGAAPAAAVSLPGAPGPSGSRRTALGPDCDLISNSAVLAAQAVVVAYRTPVSCGGVSAVEVQASMPTSRTLRRAEHLPVTSARVACLGSMAAANAGPHGRLVCQLPPLGAGGQWGGSASIGVAAAWHLATCAHGYVAGRCPTCVAPVPLWLGTLCSEKLHPRPARLDHPGLSGGSRPETAERRICAPQSACHNGRVRGLGNGPALRLTSPSPASRGPLISLRSPCRSSV